MATQRQYEAAIVFNARIVDMRHLWEPSREYRGQPTQKPNYFAMFIVKKSAPTWHADPGLANITQALGRIYQANPHVLSWPIQDGDLPNAEGKSSEYAKGHWLFTASSGNPPNVEIVQAGGALAKLTGKIGVKSGDYVMAGVTAAVKQNDPRGVKFYLNAVVFSGPGEEIVFANSVSGAELMQQAQRQGLQVAGFAPTGGFGGHGGFNPAPQHGGFAPPPNTGAPGFTPPPAFAPPPAGAPAFGASQTVQAPTGFGASGNTTSHFSPAPGSFGQPAPFPSR